MKARPQKRKIAVQLSHISKSYTIHHEKPTFSEQLLFRRKKARFTSIKDLSLTIYQGEKVGIVGGNGSGKTTLLKIIAGISTPNKGKVLKNGKVISLINLEAGFHQDLTGEENIYLNGLVIGMTRKEILTKFAQIVEFSGIGQFIDVPLYTYSEGMKLRLGFAIAVHAEPDILILDEGIAAGDQNFNEKIEKKMKTFFKENKTVIVVSHNMGFLEKNVNRIIWLKDGDIREKGGKEVIKRYLKEI